MEALVEVDGVLAGDDIGDRGPALGRGLLSCGSHFKSFKICQ